MCAVAIVWSANHSCRSWDRSPNAKPTTPTTAAKLLSELAGKEFQSARQLAAYAGLTPAERRSGYSLYGKTRLSKIGNAFLRKALYLPAAAARRWCKPLKPWIVSSKAANSIISLSAGPSCANSSTSLSAFLNTKNPSTLCSSLFLKPFDFQDRIYRVPCSSSHFGSWLTSNQ